MTSLIDPKNPAFWADGKKRSQGHAFDWRNWTLKCDWGALVLSKKLTQVQADRVDRARANGNPTGTIPGLSRAADEHRFATAKHLRHPTRGAMVSIENREVGRASTDRRAAIRKAAI